MMWQSSVWDPIEQHRVVLGLHHSREAAEAATQYVVGARNYDWLLSRGRVRIEEVQS